MSNTPEWKVVSEEAPSMFSLDELGEQFIGTWLGFTTIQPDENDTDSAFSQARFRGEDGELYATNAGYDLRQALAKVEPGSLTRITLLKFIDTGQPSPMKSHRVEVAS